MMKHWLSVKERYQDCIIFYRLGDFYEMFFEDAQKASQILELTLTGRDCGLEERAPMCGVPFHSCDGYIAKLVENGQKVAICEQLEDPSQVKAGQIVHRDVIRVVTPGTIIEESHLNEKENNFISCGYQSGEVVALAWADITTGDFFGAEYQGALGLKSAINQLVKLGVKEVICNEEFLLSTKNFPEVSRGILPHFSNYLDYAFGKASAERTLCEQFSVKTLSSYAINGHDGAISAAGALLEYLRDTQMHAISNVSSIKLIEEKQYMQLDSSAIRNLELVKNLAEGKKYGSLLWLLDKTRTGMGARLLNSMILSPLSDQELIDYRLNGVQELYDSTVISLAISDMLREVKDIERLTGKISNNNILPKDCLALATSLTVIPNIKFQLAGFTSSILGDVAKGLVDMSQIAEYIQNAIVDFDQLPTQMKEGGYIRSGFNQELDELRSIQENGTQLLMELENRERDLTGIRNLRVNYNRVFGYYIEVTKSFKDKVPLHYQRRQTLANAERYTTDELKELEEKILSSTDKSLKIEAKIYDEIKGILLANIENLKSISSSVALLDVLVAFAVVAKNNRYIRPKIVEGNMPYVIKEGRHPVVECISQERFVPNDTLLDEEENRTMIITGPNMAGKSTYMRQNAIIAIMAHIGSFVPAKSAQIPVMDKIFTRVGASDNLIYDQSTFMVEMIEVASILQNATRNSLLILDEVGRGTSTYDGLSIAWAVIEHITQKIGAKTLFATHYHELTELENTIQGIKNYKISVKELNGSIVFLRKIMRGGANRSFGIEVASLAGVPMSVTLRAKQILKMVESGDVVQHIECEEQQPTISEVEKILSEVDVNNLSPMQAFMLVSDLVEKVKNG